MTVEEILAIFSIVSGSLIVIQAYLVFRVDRARFRLETYLGISEKSELTIKPQIQPGTRETIVLINNGLIPIEEIEAKIDARIMSTKQQDVIAHFEWERKTILSNKEQAVIPLYEKLSKLIKDKGFVTYEEERFLTEDPETGEDVEDILQFPRITRQFSCELSLEVKSTMQRQSKSAKKKFILHYTYAPKSYYDADYEITVNEHMGTWKSQI